MNRRHPQDTKHQRIDVSALQTTEASSSISAHALVTRIASMDQGVIFSDMAPAGMPSDEDGQMRQRKSLSTKLARSIWSEEPRVALDVNCSIHVGPDSNSTVGPVATTLRWVTANDWAIWHRVRLAALADAPEAFGSMLADWQDAPER